MGDELVTIALLTAFSIGIGTGSLMCERLSGGKIELGLVPIGAMGLTVFAVDLFLIGSPQTLEIPLEEGITLLEFLKMPIHWRVLFDLVCIGLLVGFISYRYMLWSSTVPVYS